MGLSSFFKRGAPAPSAKRVSDSADAVQTLRVRARRRLIGAAVLVGLGVIGFPLVFETQPRPIPVDLPIDIPRQDTAPALVIPPAASQVAASVVSTALQPESQATSQAEAKPDEKPETTAVAAPLPVLVPAAPSGKPQTESEPPVTRPADKPVDKPRAADHSAEASRVQSLLDDKAAVAPAAAASAGRYIVQFGAYADAKAAHVARMKVERLGMKTYAQEVQTAEGTRIRVRIGPFSSHDEAAKAAARVRSAGLSTAVLTL